MESYFSLASELVWHSLLNSLHHLEILALDTPYSAMILLLYRISHSRYNFIIALQR